MKFRLPEFPVEPTQEQLSGWKQCFFYGLTINAINAIREDYHKLTFFKSNEGTGRFTFLSGATDFEEAIGIWDAQFKKPSRNK